MRDVCKLQQQIIVSVECAKKCEEIENKEESDHYIVYVCIVAIEELFIVTPMWQNLGQ